MRYTVKRVLGICRVSGIFAVKKEIYEYRSIDIRRS